MCKELETRYSPSRDAVIFSLDGKDIAEVTTLKLLELGLVVNIEYRLFSGREARLGLPRGWVEVVNTIQDCSIYGRAV